MALRQKDKFVGSDFINPQTMKLQHFNLSKEAMGFRKVLIGKERDGSQVILGDKELAILLRAKSRRHPDYFNGVLISANHEFGNLKAVLKLAQQVYSQKARTHVIYKILKNDEEHYFGFDFCVNKANKLSIFCIDAAHQLEDQISMLMKFRELLEKDGIPYEISICSAAIQSDITNCGYFQYAILSEIAKYPDFHETLKSLIALPEPVIAGKENLWVKDARWIWVIDLPLKIIFMTQSYKIMLELLEYRREKNPIEMIKEHKKKYAYSEENKKFYYINKRREKTATFASDVFFAVNPIIHLLNTSILISVDDVNACMQDFTAQQKLNAIITGSNYFYQGDVLLVKGSLQQKTNNIAVLREVLLQCVLALKDKDNEIVIPHTIIVDEIFELLLDDYMPGEENERTYFRTLLNSIKKNKPNYPYLLADYRHKLEVRDELLQRYGIRELERFAIYEVNFRVSAQTSRPTFASQIVKLSPDNLAAFFKQFPTTDSLIDIDNVSDFLKDCCTDLRERTSDDSCSDEAESYSSFVFQEARR